MNTRISDAAAKFDAALEHIGGCSDSACLIVKPQGMHTNGGCKCMDEKLKAQRMAYAANQLRAALPLLRDIGNPVSGDALAKLVASWRACADKHEANALEADSIGDMTATVQDLETKCEVFRQVAGELEAALAASQPVEQPMRSDLSGYVVAAAQVRRGYDVECTYCGKFCDAGPGPCQPVGQEPVAFMVRWKPEGGFGLEWPKNMQYFRDRADEYEIVPLHREVPPAQAVAPSQSSGGGEVVEYACTNCDRKDAEIICPTCAGIAWDNGRLHEFNEIRELSTSLGEGPLDHLLPDDWHDKPLLRFQGAYDDGDPSVGMPGSCGNVLAADQEGTVLGDYLAARAAKEGVQ